MFVATTIIVSIIPLYCFLVFEWCSTGFNQCSDSGIKAHLIRHVDVQGSMHC